ncbi:MAG: hypothetical protein OJF49_002835 [Ktedonobacterales bacterium]|nr:MAG: hypothetical protein OJF49_002835 [Ktedonobacterales bacterium]
MHLDRQAIMEAVRQLPTDEQWEIAREIVQTAPRREPPPTPDRGQGSAMSLRGIVRTARPLDETALLDEIRRERYD